jgi:hypothetical protein
VLAAAIIAVGCGAPAEDGGGAGGAEPERRFLSVGTAPPGGTFFVVGGALAEVLDAHGPWRVTAEATKGTQENVRRLERDELDLALANSSITFFAVRGEEGWERPYPVASAMTLAPNVGMFLAREGSGIESLGDLAGRRVVIGPAGAGTLRLQHAAANGEPGQLGDVAKLKLFQDMRVMIPTVFVLRQNTLAMSVTESPRARRRNTWNSRDVRLCSGSASCSRVRTSSGTRL